MNKRSQSALRDFASELPRPDNPHDDSPGPFEMARLMVNHNNDVNGAELDLWTAWHQAPDHRWYDLAWVFEPGGDVIMCWWQQTLCPECNGEGSVTFYDNSTDGITGGRACEQKHPDPPPSLPVPPQAGTVPGHDPGCDGTCNFEYPDGCCPF